MGEVVHFTPEDSIICVASMSDEFYQDSVPDEEVLQLLRDLEIEFKCNVWLKPFLKLEEPFLFVFDLDSTLIKLETIDELAKFAGAEEQIKVHLHTHS